MRDGHLATLGADPHPVQVAKSATAAEPEARAVHAASGRFTTACAIAGLMTP
jgi:hypothetical protein